MPYLFTIEDANELRGLLAGLLEAKFHSELNDPVIPGSLSLAAVCNRVVESLIAYEESQLRWGVAEEYRRWRRAEQHPNWVAVVERQIAECPSQVWQEWSQEQKRNYVQVLLSPLIAEDALLNRLILTVT